MKFRVEPCPQCLSRRISDLKEFSNSIQRKTDIDITTRKEKEKHLNLSTQFSNLTSKTLWTKVLPPIYIVCCFARVGVTLCVYLNLYRCGCVCVCVCECVVCAGCPLFIMRMKSTWSSTTTAVTAISATSIALPCPARAVPALRWGR